MNALQDKSFTLPFAGTADANGIVRFDKPVIFKLGASTVCQANLKTAEVISADQRTVDLTVTVSKLSLEQILTDRGQVENSEEGSFSKKNLGDVAYAHIQIHDDDTCVLPIDPAGCAKPKYPADLVDNGTPPRPYPLDGVIYSVDGNITSQGAPYLPGTPVTGFVALVYNVSTKDVGKKKKAGGK